MQSPLPIFVVFSGKEMSSKKDVLDSFHVYLMTSMICQRNSRVNVKSYLAWDFSATDNEGRVRTSKIESGNLN